MSPAVAIDTLVLIRGVREEIDSSDPSAVPRAVSLIGQCREKQTPILLPSPALNEFLAGTPQGDVHEVMKELSKGFVIEPFDGYAAYIAGEIWRKHHAIMEAKAYGLGKQCMKVDLMVFATAIAKGATTLYAEDGWFSRIAKEYVGTISVKPMPPVPDRQPPLFDT